MALILWNGLFLADGELYVAREFPISCAVLPLALREKTYVAMQNICHTWSTGLSACVRGRTRKAFAKEAVAMKKIISQLLCCAVMTLSAAAAERARLHRIADPVPVSPCQDSMETVPATDDLEPVLIATADVSCKVPPTPISA
jgi:hypothetical protein